MVHEKYAPGSLAFGVSKRADVNTLRAAVHSVGPRISCAVGKLVGLNGPDQFRMGWIRLRIQNMETRKPDAWGDKITTLDMRMRRVSTQTRATGIPDKGMKLISYGVKRMSNDLSQTYRLRVHVNYRLTDETFY